MHDTVAMSTARQKDTTNDNVRKNKHAAEQAHAPHCGGWYRLIRWLSVEEHRYQNTERIHVHTCTESALSCRVRYPCSVALRIVVAVERLWGHVIA